MPNAKAKAKGKQIGVVVKINKSAQERIDSIQNAEIKSEKKRLLELYQTLKDLNVRSISDLENLIAKAEDH